MNNNIWKTGDPVWMAEREKGWLHVKENLDKMDSVIPKRSQRFHKELFFEGKVDPTLSDVTAMMRENIEEPFGGCLPLFQMWYLPEPNIENFREIFESITDLFTKERCRTFIFSTFSQYTFPEQYGMFGGREKLLVETFILGFDYKDQIKIGRQKYAYNVLPSSLIKYCAGHTSGLLASGLINPYAPGQYLWDNLAYTIGSYPKEAFKKGYEETMLRTCLRHILDWDERPDSPKELANSVALRNQLFERFEANDFTSALMKYWHEEKQAYENGEPYPE
jgi:hypothetical protein